MSQPAVKQIVLASRPKGPPVPCELPPRGGAVAAIAARRPAVARAVSITRSLHARPDGRRENEDLSHPASRRIWVK